MHFPKKENTLSQHNNVDNLRPDAARPGPAWPWHTQQGDSGVGRGLSEMRGVLCLIVDHSCWVLYAFLLSVCVCVYLYVYVCVCAVYGESVKSWWAHRSICHPHIVYLVAAAAESLPQFLPPSSPLSPPSPYLRCVCVCAYKSHKSVREVMSKQAVNMFV